MKILISGGSRGLGRQIAITLASNPENEVHTFSRSDVSEQSPSNLKHFCNVDILQDTNKLNLELYDVLINNAGVGYSGYLAKQDPEKIKETLNINTLSVIQITQKYIQKRFNLGGNIINISSIVSKRGYPGLSVYSASKGALNSFTQALAVELAGKGFRVNAILPGYIETKMTEGLPFDKIIINTPSKKLSTKQDIANIIEFLLSDKASNITGQLITIDGGYTV